MQGPLAPFDISQTAIPTFDIGQLAGISPDPTEVATAGPTTYLPVAQPAMNDADQFDGGIIVNPSAARVLIDTGQLTAGPHLITGSAGTSAGTMQPRLEWRNAANSATLASWTGLAQLGKNFVIDPFVANIATDERLRWVVILGLTASVFAYVGAVPSTNSVIT